VIGLIIMQICHAPISEVFEGGFFSCFFAEEFDLAFSVSSFVSQMVGLEPRPDEVMACLPII